MTKAEMQAFLHGSRLAVISTSGKYANRRADPRVALVIGWETGQTVQLEGIAELLSGNALDACKRSYFAAWPDRRERERGPNIAYRRVRPRWLRYSDFNQTSSKIEQLTIP